ncbi:MAG: hypothetical protein U9P80_02920 [Thermodesulfobacteriota bacterium]|nr:hypothetical protein [Thermodesulfobacteriota bacterium]
MQNTSSLPVDLSSPVTGMAACSMDTVCRVAVAGEEISWTG